MAEAMNGLSIIESVTASVTESPTGPRRMDPLRMGSLPIPMPLPCLRIAYHEAKFEKTYLQGGLVSVGYGIETGKRGGA